MSPVCGRFLEGEVFDEAIKDCTAFVLIGASHLSQFVKHLKFAEWKISNLTIG